MNYLILNIAGFDLYIENKVPIFSYSINYKPFLVMEKSCASPLLTLNFRQLPAGDRQPVFYVQSEEGRYQIYLGEDECDITFFYTGSTKPYRMYASNAWSEIIVDMDASSPEDLSVLNNFIMLAFIYSAAFHDTILIHASCIKYGEEGVAFMGHSGIGKSTHARLWLEHIKGSSLLNDDQPAIRIIHGEPILFGTPWSGKTDCYVSEKARLNTIFVMEQSKKNELVSLTRWEFFEQLLSSCSLMREDMKSFDCIMQTLSVVSKTVKASILRSYPGSEAAELSFSYSIMNKKSIE